MGWKCMGLLKRVALEQKILWNVERMMNWDIFVLELSIKMNKEIFNDLSICWKNGWKRKMLSFITTGTLKSDSLFATSIHTIYKYLLNQ